MSNKFHFPVNYKPKYDYDKTLSFINLFTNAIEEFINIEFSARKTMCSLINSVIDIPRIYRQTNRKVFFDNYNTNSLFYLEPDIANTFKTQDNLLKLKKEQSLYTKTLFINRDAKLTNVDSIIKDVIYIYIKDININESRKIIYDICQKILKNINNILDLDIFKQYEFKKTIFDNVNNVNLLDIIKSEYSKTSTNSFISEYLSDNGPSLFFNIDPLNKFECFDFSHIDPSNKFQNAALYVYHNKSNSPIRLIKASLIPNTNNLIIQIDLSNLFMYILNKVHIAEVVSSAWDEEFKEFVTKNNIQIL